MLKIWVQSKKALAEKIDALQNQIDQLNSEKHSLEKSINGLKDAEEFNYALFKDAHLNSIQKIKENEGLKLRIECLSQDLQSIKQGRAA